MITKQLPDGTLRELTEEEYREMLDTTLNELLDRYVEDEEYELAAACRDRIKEAKDQSFNSVKDAVTKLKVLMFIEQM